MHVRMEQTWDDCIRRAWGQTTVGLCVASPWGSLFLPFDEIGNGAVIEVLKTTRCGYVTRVIAIGHRRGKARNVRAAVKFLFIPLTRQLRPLDARARTRLFFLYSFFTHARTHACTSCVQAARMTNRRGDISHPVITSRRASIRRVCSTKGDCRVREIFALSVWPLLARRACLLV